MTPKDVWQSTTGSVARIEAGEPLVLVVDGGSDDVVEPNGELELELETELELELELDFVTGCDVEAEWLLGMDGAPHPAITTSPDNPRPTTHTVIVRFCGTRTPPPNAPATDYASTVRSSSRSAKRRCASARRVGMCSDGTSCAT